jgi:hypothetical protein
MAFIFNPDWKPPGYSAARRVCVVCDRPTIETDVMLYDEEPVDGDGWPLRWWMAHGICMWAELHAAADQHEGRARPGARS